MDLPPKLRFSHGLLNIQNEDNKCFLWSILAALHPVQRHHERVSNYIQYEDTLNFQGIDFPISLSRVEKFEKQNKLTINVFGYEDGQVFPLYLSKMGILVQKSTCCICPMKTIPITVGLKISVVFLVTQTNIMVNVFIVIDVYTHSHVRIY